MSCISSNFSSFFLDSLNDPSEFAKYLSNGENKLSSFEDFQVFGSSSTSYSSSSSSSSNSQQHHYYHQHQQQYFQQQQNNGSVGCCNQSGTANSSSSSSSSSGLIGATTNGSAGGQSHSRSEICNGGIEINNISQQQQYVGHPHTSNLQQSRNNQLSPSSTHQPHSNSHQELHSPQQTHQRAANHVPGVSVPLQKKQRWSSANLHNTGSAMSANVPASSTGAQHFDGSFEFLKYLRHSSDYSNETCSNSVGDDDITPSISTAPLTAAASQHPAVAASLIDLDTSTSMKPQSARKTVALLSSVTRPVTALDTTLDVFEHDDSKHTIFDLQQHTTSSSNSNEESSMDVSNLAFPNSLLSASNSNTSCESAAGGSADFSNINAMVPCAPKPLASVVIKENFEVHPAHKVEEGIFQHMNKLPPKKKETLKQLGVRFTGQMTLADKSIVADNFIKFCQEYEITDHRPYLSLNQSGLNKPEQIKFARYLGQGLPAFTLFCIYSNFKNLFCTKRIENYTKDGYNLPYILEKTKRFLANTTAGGIATTPNKQILHCTPPTPLHTPMSMDPTI